MKSPMTVDLPPTSWSLLGAAVEEGSTAAREAFVRRYYEPVFAYLAALSGDRDRAEDLTQAFFAARIFERSILPAADRSIGSFRCYLKRAVRNWFLDSVRRDGRLKRGGGARAVPIEDAGAIADARSEPDRMFHAAWVRSLLRDAMARVHADCIEAGQAPHFEMFVRRFLPEEAEPPSWAALGEAYGLDDKAARGRAETVARRLRRVLRDMLRIELGTGVDEELAIMQMLLSGDRA